MHIVPWKIEQYSSLLIDEIKNNLLLLLFASARTGLYHENVNV